MSDLSGPSDSVPGDLPPTQAMPATPPPTQAMPASPPTTQAMPATPPPTDPPTDPALIAKVPAADEYGVDDRDWYRKPGPLAGIAIAVVLLLVIGLIVLLAGGDDDDAVVVTSESEDSVQLDIARITRTEEPVAATITATVTGPTDTPAEYQWILPPGAQAPEPAVGSTDDEGGLKFTWAPIDEPEDDTTWSSTVTLAELLPANATLDAASFECVLDRDDVESNITLSAEVEALPVTDPRNVTYRFDGVEFVPGDSVTCTILAGDPNAETTTTSTSTSTTVAPSTTDSTTTIPTTTVAPTTVPAVVPVTPAPTTAAPAPTTAATTTTTTTTTLAPKTTVQSLIDARGDLSTFKNLIDRAGLREQLTRQDGIFTIVAPTNAAIDELLASENPPDLNDPAAARDFVLAHVKSGEILQSSDLAARSDVTFDAGPARTIDATISPITIGGASVTQADSRADTGVLHTLGRTLVTPAT